MVDTCQAATLYSHISAPNVCGIGSSKKDESSYSYHNDHSLGISLVDRFTHHTLRFFERGGIKSRNTTLLSLFESFSFEQLHSNAQWKFIKFDRSPQNVKITDFFSAVSSVDLLKENVVLTPTKDNGHSHRVQPLLIDFGHSKQNEKYKMSAVNEWFDGLAAMTPHQLLFVTGSIFVCLLSVEINYIHRLSYLSSIAQ